MIEAKYLVISMENQCVFAMAKDPVTANSLSASNLNTFVRAITRHNFEDFEKINRDFFRSKVYKLEFRDKRLLEIDPALVSQAWKDERDAMHFRSDGHGFLEINYLSAMAPVERSHWSSFSEAAWYEIMQCDPANNLYTRYIEEYARIVSKPIDQTYKELKLKIEGERFVRFRVTALVERWKVKINQIQTEEDFQKAMKGMFDEFWQKSLI